MGGPTVPYQERVHVTIDHNGKIFLNQKAHKMVGKALAVYLYYNRQKDSIILEPTDALTASNAFSLKESGYGARVIYANPFCKHFNIRIKGTVKFIHPTKDAVGRLYLKLSETINVSLGKRPRKKRKDD